jgi:hypothetical protein
MDCGAYSRTNHARVAERVSKSCCSVQQIATSTRLKVLEHQRQTEISAFLKAFLMREIPIASDLFVFDSMNLDLL